MSNQPPGYPPAPPPGHEAGQQPPMPPYGYGPGQQPAPGQYPQQYPQGAPPPPAKSGAGRTCLIIGVIAAVVVVVIIAGTVLLGITVFKAATGPADATNAYLADIQAGNVDAAYARLCSSMQSRFSRSDFNDLVEAADKEKGAITSYYVFSTNVNNNQGYVQYTLTRERGQETIGAELVKENGEWKLCQFTS